MDGKVSLPAGEQVGTKDTRYLQQELGHVLPSALATVTELQPSDPITALALLLYKYRELNPLPAPTTDISNSSDSPKHESPSHNVTMTVPKPAPFGIQKPGSIQIVHNDDCDDFIEDSGYFNLGDSSAKADVHCEVVPMLLDIGDLFDDDDIR